MSAFFFFSCTYIHYIEVFLPRGLTQLTYEPQKKRDFIISSRTARLNALLFSVSIVAYAVEDAR